MPIVEYASNNPVMRLNANLFMVDGYAKDEVSKATVVSERFVVTILNKYIEQRTSMQTTIRDLLISNTSGGDAIVPIIKFSKISEGAMVGTASTVGTGGAGIFRNGKLVEPILTAEQTSAAKSIRNQLGQYYFSVPSPTDEKQIGFYSVIVNVKTSIIKRENKFHVVVKPISEVLVLSNNSNIDFTRYDQSRMMEKSIEQYINKMLTQAMSTIQQTGADVFHFDRYFSVKYPNEWKNVKSNWREFYREQLVVDIQNTVNLSRKGSVVRSFTNLFQEPAAEGGTEQ
jgi:spore germination protein KC